MALRRSHRSGFAVTSEVHLNPRASQVRRTRVAKALLDLHVLFEDALHIALSSLTAASRRKGRSWAEQVRSDCLSVRTEARALPACKIRLLSWGCPKIAPSSTYVSSVHSRASIDATHAPCLSHPSAWSCHRQARSVLVVPPDFDGFLRSNAAGLLHPAANHGVHCVSAQARYRAVDRQRVCFIGLLLRSLPLTIPHLVSRRLPRSVRLEIPLEPPSEGFPSAAAVPALIPESGRSLQATLPRGPQSTRPSRLAPRPPRTSRASVSMWNRGQGVGPPKWPRPQGPSPPVVTHRSPGSSPLAHRTGACARVPVKRLRGLRPARSTSGS
jgi:hypothetical protein